MKRALSAILLASLALCVLATQLRIHIIEGSDASALYYVWNSYTSYWRQQEGSFTAEQFFAANSDFRPVTDPAQLDNLQAAVRLTLAKDHHEPNDFHTVAVFSYRAYHYALLSANAAPMKMTVYPCYLMAFDKNYGLQATFWG